MNHKILALMFFILLTPNLVLASLADDFKKIIGIPEEYKEFPELFKFIILPFLGSFALVFGLLSKIGTFENPKVDVILALMFAFGLLYTGYLLRVVLTLYKFGTFTVFVIFVGIFVFGSWNIGKKKVFSPLSELRQVERSMGKRRGELDKLLHDLAVLRRRLAHETNTDRITSLTGKIQQLEGQIDKLRGEIAKEQNRIDALRSAAQTPE